MCPPGMGLCPEPGPTGSSKEGLCRAPPWGATRPGASRGRARPPPHVVPTMVVCPSARCCSSILPSPRPLCVFLSLLGSPRVPRVSHSPHTRVGAKACAHSPPTSARGAPCPIPHPASGGGGSEMPPMRQIGPQTPFPSTNTTLLRTHGCRGVPKRMQAHEGVPGARPRLCCPVPVPPLGPRHHLHQRPTEPRTGLGWKGHLGPANSSPKPASCSLPAPRISPLCLLCAPLLPQFAPFALPVCSLCSPSLLPA